MPAAGYRHRFRVHDYRNIAAFSVQHPHTVRYVELCPVLLMNIYHVTLMGYQGSFGDLYRSFIEINYEYIAIYYKKIRHIIIPGFVNCTLYKAVL